MGTPIKGSTFWILPGVWDKEPRSFVSRSRDVFMRYSGLGIPALSLGFRD